MRRSWILCLVAACGSDSELTANERALAGDGLRSVEAEAVLIDTVERSFSGLIQFTPVDDTYKALHDAAASSVTTAQARLTPQGCLDANKSALVPAAPTNPVIDYVLTGCSAGGHTIEGTVTSTWVLHDTVRVVHEVDLMIDGVPTTGKVSVNVYVPLDDGPETRQRSYMVTSSGLQLAGAWAAVVGADGCGTKTGRGSITIDSGRTFERIDDLAFCASEGLDAVTGTVDLARDGLDLRVHLLGDGEASVFTRTRSQSFAAAVDDLLD